MANSNDFYLSFGSNASAFATKLAADLAPVDATINALAAKLAKMSAASGQVASNVASIRGGGGGGGGNPTSVENSGLPVAEIRALVQGMAAYDTHLGKVVTQIASVAKRLETTSESVRQDRIKDSRAAGAVRALPQRFVGPDGRFVSSTTPGARPAGANAPQKSAPVSIAGTPRVLIEEATFSRVVKAIDAQTKETRRVRKAVEDLGRGRPNEGGVRQRSESNVRQIKNQQAATANEERVGTLKAQLAKRNRLEAARKELERVQTGGEIDQAGVLAAAGGIRGSKSLRKVGKETGYTGPAYEAQLTKAINSLSKELKGAPSAAKLRAQIANAPAAAPTQRSATKPAGVAAVNQKLTGLETSFAELEKKGAQVAKLLGDSTGAVADEAREALRMIEAQKGQLKATLDDVRREAGGKKATGESEASKAEKKAARRAAAEAERRARGKLKPQERVDTQRDLDLGASEANLRDPKLRKADLQRIAKSYAQEGYGDAIGFDPTATKAGGQRVTSDRLIQGILNARKEFDASGGTTRNDLTASAKVMATEVPKSVRQMVRQVVEASKMTAEDKRAYNIRRYDRRLGGDDTALMMGDGQQRYARGRTQRGIGIESSAGIDVRKLMEGMERQLADRTERISEAALQSSFQLVKNPAFNPYNPEIRTSIKGNSDESKDARSGLGKIIRATDAIDKVMGEFLALTREVDKSEASLKRMNAQLLRQERAGSKTPGMRESASATRAQMEIEAGRLASNKARLGDFPDLLSVINTPAYRQGREVREQARTTYREESALRGENARARSEVSRAVSDGLGEALAGSRQRANVKAGGGDLADLRKLLPGLVTGGRGRNANNFRFDQNVVGPNGVKPTSTDLGPLNVQRRKYEGTLLKIGSLPEDVDPKVASDLQKRAVDQLGKLLETYKALGIGEARVAIEDGRIVDYNPDAVSKKAKRGRVAGTAENDPANTYDPAVYEREQRKRAKAEAKAAERAAATATPSSKGGKGGGKGGGKDGGAEATSTPAGGDILSRILAAINTVNATLKSGVRISSAPPVADKPAAVTEGRAAPLARAEREAALAVGGAAGTRPAPLTSAERQRIQQEAARVAGAAAVPARSGPKSRAEREAELAASATTGARAMPQTRAAREAAESMAAAIAAATAPAAEATTTTRARRSDPAESAAAEAAAARRRALIGEGNSNTAERAGQLARQEAAANQSLTAIMARLTERTKAQIEALKRLKREGADSTKIAEQQVRVYRSLSQELTAGGASAAQVRSSARTVMGGAGIRTSERELTNVARAADIQGDLSGARGAGSRMGMEMGDTAREVFAQSLFGNTSFWGRVMNSTGTFIVRNFSAGLVFGLTAALQDVISQAIETESTFIRVSQAMESTGRSVGGLRTNLQSISTDYGVALLDVYESAAGLTGLFEGADEIASATRIVAQLEMISNGALTAKEGMGALASISSAFGDTLGGVDGLQHIADVLTTIQNRVGVNVEVTAEGVGRLAGLANQIGLTFEETAVYVGEIAKRTNQTGAAAGEQFSRIVSVMQTGRGQKALTDTLGEQGIGAALGAGDYSTALKILMSNYESLTKSQQDNIAVTLGGQRQAASLAALLHDGADALNTVEAATNSKGAADERSIAISKTLNAQIKILQSNFVNFGAAIVRSGVVSFFAAMLLGVNEVLGGVNHLMSVFNDVTESNPLLNLLSKAALAALGLAAAFKVVRAAAVGMRTWMAGGGVTATAVGSMRQPIMGGAVSAAGRQRDPMAMAGNSLRQRAMALAVRQRPENQPGFLSRPTNRLADPTAGPTSRLGRGLEAVTAGPLRGFSTALQRGSQALTAVATAQRGAGLNSRADLTQRYAGYAANNARRLDTGARVAEYTMRGRADLLATGAANRLQDQSSRFSSNAAIAGALGQRGTQAANALAASAASGAATATRGFSTALRRVSMNGATAQGAMVGLGLAFTAVITEMVRAKALAADVQRAYEGRFGPDSSKTDEEKKENYVGPATDLVKENAKRFEGGGSNLVQGIMSVWADNINPKNWLKSDDSIAAEAVGDLSNEAWGELDKIMQLSFDALGNAGKGTVEDVTRAQQNATNLISAQASQIASNDDLSSEQKSTALSYLEGLAKSIEKTGTNLRLNIEGLNTAERLSSSQINEVLTFMGPLASNPTAGANNPDSIKAMMGALGLGSGTEELDKSIRALAEGQGSTSDLIGEQLDITETLLKNATSTYDSRVSSGAPPEDIEKSAQQMIGLMTQAESLKRQIIDAEIQAAQDFATYLEGTGDYAGAQAELRSAAATLKGKVDESRQRRANDAFNKQGGSFLRPGLSLRDTSGDLLTPEEEQANIGRAAQLGQTATNLAVTEANRNDRIAAMSTRNATALAGIQLRMANNKVKVITDAVARDEATDEMLLAAQEEQQTALYAAADAGQAVIVARFAASSASLLNQVSKANNDEAGAWQAANYARKAFGANSAEYLNALASARSASQAVTTAVLEELAAARETELARIAPGDLVSRANKTLQNAQQAQADAARFGTSSVQYQQATQQLIAAQQGVDTAIFGVADANSGLATALAQAAGKTVDVARLQLEKAQEELRRAQAQGGGARTADVINAEAGVASANAGLRDATLQDGLDTIDFQQNMDQITSRGAIAMLTELLNMKDLTEAQRRDILMKIKSLEDELASTMEGVFNMPENIKVPTVYEVRRALGVDQYLRTMKDATASDLVSSGVTSSTGSANQILSEIRAAISTGANVVPTSTEDYSHSNNTVTVNGADFNQVVQWLEGALGSGAQVTRSLSSRRN